MTLYLWEQYFLNNVKFKIRLVDILHSSNLDALGKIRQKDSMPDQNSHVKYILNSRVSYCFTNFISFIIMVESF